MNKLGSESSRFRQCLGFCTYLVARFWRFGSGIDIMDVDSPPPDFIPLRPRDRVVRVSSIDCVSFFN